MVLATYVASSVCKILKGIGSNMKHLTAFFLAALCSGMASAQTFGMHLGSQHNPDPGGRANNLNPGLYVRFDNGASLGFYKNSVNRDSTYFGYTSDEWYRMRIGVGMINGYLPDGGPTAGWMPIVFPSVRLFTYEKINFLLVYLPKIGADGQEIMHFTAETRF